MSTIYPSNPLENVDFQKLEKKPLNEETLLVATLLEAWTVRGVSGETRRQSKIAALMTGLSIGEFVDGALLAAVQGGGAAMRERVPAASKGKKGKIWTIRGVKPETRRLSRIAALQLGWTVGDFVDRALLSATERLQTENPHPLKQTA